MKKIIIIFLIQFAANHLLFAQYIINGKINSFNTQEVIPYVNIGIKNKNIGTISRLDGGFTLSLKEEFLNDTLTFSCVGFEEQNYLIKEIIGQQSVEIKLKEKIIDLPEIEVGTRKPKTKKLGTESTNPLLWGNIFNKTGTDMVEFGRQINIKELSEIQQLSVYLKGINIDSVSFRINFYSVKDDLPDQKIVEQNIIKRESIKKGWLDIDLSEFQIFVDEDIFVCIEVLPNKSLNTYSFSYGGQFGGSYVSRYTSLGKWSKASGASISMYLTLKEYK